MNFEGLLSAIESADSIALFRHQHPDCDAMGSQCAFASWIADNYPEKNVYKLGSETCDQYDFPQMDSVSDDQLKNCLAIVLDTANEDRVDDKRYHLCRGIIKIDHHPNHEPFGNRQYASIEYAATCEILSEFFHSCKDHKMSRNTAVLLYCGLLTDTLCFRTTNTTAHTLAMASWLADYGVPIPEVNRRLFDQNLREFEIANEIRSLIRMKGEHLAYCCITLKQLQKWNITASQARNFIDELGHVKEFEVWCIFTEKREKNQIQYDGSIRSKSIAVNEIALHYSGGGHRNAAGVKNLTEETLKNLLDRLILGICDEDHKQSEIHRKY